MYSNRIRSLSTQLASFATSHWKALSLISVIVGVFAWTNWYFSPAKRLERLAAAMHQSAVSEISLDDIIKMMDLLHIPVGGSTNVSSFCFTSTCEVTVSHYYRTGLLEAGPEKKTWRLEVKVTLMPLFSDPDEIGLLPQSIKWTELDWRWSVGIIDRKDSRKNVFYSGNWNQINQAPTIEGANTITSLLNAIAVGMRKELYR